MPDIVTHGRAHPYYGRGVTATEADGGDPQAHFWASIIYPLTAVDLRRLSAEWTSGPFAGRTGSPHVTGANRTRFYANPRPAQRLLHDARRRHRDWPGGLRADGVSSLVVDAAELVSSERSNTAPLGYAVLHVSADGPEIESFSTLADVVRPRRQAAQRLLAAVFGADLRSGAVAVLDVPRATSVVLSGWPAEDVRGLLRWSGSSALDRRLATMVTLPDSGREVELPFDLPRARPTPSYVVSVAATSVAVVRCRPLDRSHVDELRTLWLDAVLIEVRQRDVAASYAGAVTELANTASDRGLADDWGRLEKRFRAWRSRSAWQATTDHPLEQALAAAVRSASGTDRIIGRVEQELRDHAEVEIRRSNDRLTMAVVALTIASLVLPLLLHLAGNDSDEVTDPAWLAAAVVAGAVVLVTAAMATAAFRRR